MILKIRNFLESYIFIIALSVITLGCYIFEFKYLPYFLVGISLILILSFKAKPTALVSVLTLELISSHGGRIKYGSWQFVIIILLLTAAGILLIIDLIMNFKKYINKLKNDYFLFITLGFILIIFLSMINSPEIGKSFFMLATYIQCILYYFIIAIKLDKTDEDRDKIIFSILVLNLIIFLQSMYVLQNELDHNTIKEIIKGKGIKVGWANSNHVMIIENFGLILCMYYFLRNNNIVKRIFTLATILSIVIINILYVCRGGYLGLLFAIPCMAVVFIIYYKRHGFETFRKDIYYYAGFIAALIVAFDILESSGVITYILKHLKEMSGDLNGRKEVYKTAVREFKNHWLIGGGANSAHYYLMKEIGADLFNYHNYALQVLAYFGIIGFIYAAYQLYLMIRKCAHKDLYNSTMLIIIVYCLAHGMVDTVFYNWTITPFLMIILALAGTYKIEEIPNDILEVKDEEIE